jgi:hypothetical protein
MSFDDDLKLIAEAKNSVASVKEKLKEIVDETRDLSLIVEEINSVGINTKIVEELDYYLIKYAHKELDTNSDAQIKKLITEHDTINTRYIEFLNLSTQIAETYSAKIKKPIPDNIKNLLKETKEKKIKIFGVAGLSSLAVLGWLGTISLGTIQILGIMATTTVPTAVMRGGPVEEEIEFDILNIEDDCVTFIYELPDQSSSITKNICLK